MSTVGQGWVGEEAAWHAVMPARLQEALIFLGCPRPEKPGVTLYSLARGTGICGSPRKSCHWDLRWLSQELEAMMGASAALGGAIPAPRKSTPTLSGLACGSPAVLMASLPLVFH